MQIVLLGTGLLAEVLCEQADRTPDVELVAFCENLDRSKAGGEMLGRPIVWVDDLPAFGKGLRAVCAISTTRREGYVEQVSALGVRFGRLVSSQAIVPASVEVGPGSVIMPGANVGPYTSLGSHVIVNRNVAIGHHVELGDFSTVQLGAIVGGATRVGKRAYVALGAKVLDRLSLGEGALVAAGAVVTKNVPAHTQVMGIPARPTRVGVTGR